MLHPCGCLGCQPTCQAGFPPRRYLFAFLHPALGGAVGLKSAMAVRGQLMSHDGLWPTAQVGFNRE
jgi:hypothetical protein